MKKIVRLLLISAILLSSVFLFSPGKVSYAQAPLNHMELTVDRESGAPGSFFTVTGHGWLEYSTVTIFVNYKPVGSVKTDITGSFVFQLDTTGAEEGYYVITTDSLEPLSVRIRLDYEYPKLEPDPIVVILEVPPDLAMSIMSLPFVIK